MKRLVTPALLLLLVEALLVAALSSRGALGLFTDTASVLGNTFTTASCFPTWWWDTNYLYRRQVTVTNNSSTDALPTGYSVQLSLDHASLVGAGKSRADGNDVRMLYWNAGTCTWSELDRVSETGWNVANAEIWFQSQAAIPASGTDGNYYLTYGYPGAGSPPAAPNNVYVFADDFEAGNLGLWTVVSGDVSATTESAVEGSYSMKVARNGVNVSVYRGQGFPFEQLLVDYYWRKVTSGYEWYLEWHEDSVPPPTTVDGLTHVRFDDSPDERYLYYDGSWHAYNDYVMGTWTHMELVYNPITGRFVFYRDDVLKVDDPNGFRVMPTDSWDFLEFSAAWSNGAGYVDDFIVRKYLTPEPSVTSGAEEPAP